MPNTRPFTGNIARPAFAVYKEPAVYSDLYYNKRSTNMYCLQNACHFNKPLGTEKNLLLFKNYVVNRKSGNSINTYQLYINLLTKLNLKDVPVIASIPEGISPVEINASAIPYYSYNVDPNGVLFGNSPCGLLNYVNFMECNFPKL